MATFKFSHSLSILSLQISSIIDLLLLRNFWERGKLTTFKYKTLVEIQTSTKTTPNNYLSSLCLFFFFAHAEKGTYGAGGQRSSGGRGCEMASSHLPVDCSVCHRRLKSVSKREESQVNQEPNGPSEVFGSADSLRQTIHHHHHHHCSAMSFWTHHPPCHLLTGCTWRRPLQRILDV